MPSTTLYRVIPLLTVFCNILPLYTTNDYLLLQLIMLYYSLLYSSTFYNFITLYHFIPLTITSTYSLSCFTTPYYILQCFTTLYHIFCCFILVFIVDGKEPLLSILSNLVWYFRVWTRAYSISAPHLGRLCLHLFTIVI